MSRPRLVIFDWDGTLADSAEHIVRACLEACAECGLPLPTAERVRDCIGLGLVETFARLAPDAGDAAHRRLARVYRERWALAAAAPPPLLAHAREALHGLAGAGVLLAVATGKGRRGLDRELRAHDLARLFDASRCADEAPSKPDPAMLHALLEETGVTPREALMVGDTEYDMQMARAADVAAVGVRSGVHDAGRLRSQRPLAVLDHVGQLGEWLSGRRAGSGDG